MSLTHTRDRSIGNGFSTRRDTRGSYRAKARGNYRLELGIELHFAWYLAHVTASPEKMF